MTTDQINKRFAELAGIHYHTFPKAKKYKDIFGNICLTNRGRKCLCGVRYNSRYKKPNPDYCADPRLVLEVMVEKGYWGKNWGVTIEGMLDKTGILALKAIEWMEENQ